LLKKNGNPLQIGKFKAGKQDGVWKRYDENGVLYDEGSYKDGQRTGEWKTYDKAGRLKRTKTFRSLT